MGLMCHALGAAQMGALGKVAAMIEKRSGWHKCSQ
jgi:hypothetical protein